MSKITSGGHTFFRFYVLDENKKRKYFYGKTEKEAKAKREAYRRDFLEKININWDKATVDDLIQDFLKYEASSKRPSTYANYSYELKHLSRDLGKRKISTLLPKDFNLFFTELAHYNPNTEKGMSKKTLETLKKAIHTLFEYAVTNRYIRFNPVNHSKLPSLPIEDPKQRCLTLEEIGWILNTPHRLQLANVIMLYVGLRPAELLALKWQDIDTDNCTITINKSVQYYPHKTVIEPYTKTNMARTAVYPKEMNSYLAEPKFKHKPTDLVVPDKNGKVYQRSTWQSNYRSYITDLDLLYGGKFKSKNDPNYARTIQGWTPYALRHTSTTMALYYGVSEKNVADNQGHTIKTMQKYYNQPLLQQRKDDFESNVSYANLIS